MVLNSHPFTWWSSSRVAAAAALLLAIVVVARLRADIEPTATFRWVTDSPVSAVAGIDVTAYLGGSFNYIGLVTEDAPSFVQQSTGALAAGCATRTGVQAGVRPVVVPDPSGGLFMQAPLADERLIDGAGEFEVSSGESFVRVGADCRFVRGFRLESFVPNDAVTRGLTILRLGGLIYVGGTRTLGFGDSYGRVAAFNGSTGVRVNAWDYDRFRAVLIEGATPGGQLVVTTTPRAGDGTRQDVGVLTPSTGAFAPLAAIESTGFVTVSGQTLYVSPAANRALQAIDLATGQPKAGWVSPVLTVNDLEFGGGRVFVAGSGLGRRGVFALSEATGALIDSFAPVLGPSTGNTLTVERLALVNDRLFLRGRTVRAVEGAPRYLLAAVNATTAAADAWAPIVFAPTSSSIDLVPLGERIYVGRVASPTLLERRHLAAVSTATGAILPFNPNGAGAAVPAPPVTALAASNSALFAATSQGQIRRVGLASGGFEPWSVATTAGGTPGAVTALELDGDTLYAGGLFTAVTTSNQTTPVARGHGAAIAAGNATLLAWDPRVVSTAANPTQARRPITTLARSGDVIIIGGDFTAVAGEARAGMAAVDRVAGNATLPGLTLEAGDVVLDSVPGPDQVYFVGTKAAGSTPTIGVADPTAGTVTEWAIAEESPPSTAVAFFEGLVYSGPEWEADTGTVVAVGTRWTRPAEVPAGLFELEEPAEGADGVHTVRFHRALEGGSVGAPRDLTVLYAGTEVYLTWRAPLRGEVESYVIRAGPASGQSSLANFDTGSSETTFWTRAPEGVYFVRVHARGASGVSGPSNEVSFALVPFGCNAVPRAPGTLSGSGSVDRATLSWGAAIGATSYRVEAGSRPGASDVTVRDVGSRLSLQALAPPGRYYVRTRGVNSCGQGLPSNEVVIAVGGPPPQPPGNLRAQIAGRTVVLEWDGPTTGEVATYFQLEAGSAPGLANVAVSRVASQHVVVPNVGPGTYYVRARAGNASGVSDPTADLVVSVQ